MKKVIVFYLFLMIAILAISCEREDRDRITTVVATVHHQYVDLSVPPDFDVIKGIKIKESTSTEWVTITGIDGFTFEENFVYELKLEKKYSADPPLDSPSPVTYKLLEILSKKQK
ncbi:MULTISPECIES: DUF4377 domain-containing protein [Chryseobacterium]|uniref:DUF4377 domain-containing protein n=1 Tax=Chryseobacterium salivictor TaxID=2547600 RepID=A0A4P6ZGW8_9FLAO|nr:MULTISPECIES: DUF4377 domain-containing protein [Chryseobacterium]MDQ0477220.1 hypothetical protein [Chryseobacterium sp. MDT2-18]QBO58645.1 hypothetical protein NBC122_01830 [Chryseobacterium salivictor]